MNIITFFPDANNAVFYHRLILPFYHFKEAAVKKCISRIPISDLEWADVMIINRCIDNKPEETRALLDQYNVKLIVDYDDYYRVPANHIVSRLYAETKMPERQIGYAEIADQVWVTNKRLKAVFDQHNDNVHIIPNALPFGEGQFQPGFNPSDRMRFFYAGGRTHQHDIELLENTCRELRKNEVFKQRGQMVLAGYDDQSMEIKDYWDKMEMIWSGRRPEWETFKRIKKLPVTQYMNLYNHADVGLIPLEDNLFNSMKSNLKILECAAKMIPAICSRISTFTDNEPPVRWVDKESDWFNHIMYYLNNPLQALEDGKALHEWAVRHHNMSDINFLRANVLKNLAREKEVVT